MVDKTGGFTCMLCSKIFKQRRYLKAHLQRCVSIVSINGGKKSPPSLKCPDCEKTFVKQSRLKRHQSHHYQTKDFLCNFCDKSFVQKPHLKRHTQTVHASETADDFVVKNKNCRYCQKSFSTNWEVSRHEKSMHKFATNLYKCRYCGDKFDNQKIYVNHLEWHKGLKKYACYVCGFAFKRNTEFTQHMSAKHRRGMVYVCILCNQEFAERIQVFRHIDTKHRKDLSISMEFDDQVQEPMFDDFDDHLQQPLVTCRFCSCKFLCKKVYFAHINDSHYKKVFRLLESYSSNEEIPSDSTANEEERLESEISDHEDFEWKNLSLKVMLDKSCVMTSRLELGKYLPEKFLSEYPSLSTLQIDLLEYVCRPEEILVIEIPVKVESTNLEKFPELLTINYV